MSEVLEQYSFQRGGMQATHPWEEWTDGRIWKITQGEDFECKPQGMRVQLTRKATLMGMKVHTSMKVDGSVIFQFYREEG